MSNFDRAVKALNDVDEAIDHLADNEAYVTALQAAGLLAPELPNKDFSDRDEMSWIRVKDGLVEVIANSGYDSDYEVRTPDEAREYALAILAAANYAEKGQGNE